MKCSLSLHNSSQKKYHRYSSSPQICHEWLAKTQGHFISKKKKKKKETKKKKKKKTMTWKKLSAWSINILKYKWVGK